MKNEKLTERFEEKFPALRAQTGKGAVLAAFSGGADSTALLLLLDGLRKKTPFDLWAMHVHHGLRGEEADRDELFCRSLCEERGIRYLCERVDVRAYAEKEKKSVEEAARILRYRALERAANERGACIVTAHHAGDQLETMLFRIARGCGGAGLSGIPERRGAIVRPLLCFTKDELLAFLAERGQDWVTDSTNDIDDCARNGIRHKAIPALREVCPEAEKNAASLARRLREDEEYLSSLLPEGPIDGETLASLPAPLRKRAIARTYAAYFGASAPMLESDHVEALCGLIRRRAFGKKLSLPGKVCAVFDRNGLTIRPEGRREEAHMIALHEGENPLWDGERSVYMMKERSFFEFWAKIEKIHTLFTKVEINSATMDGEPFARTCREGDRLRSGGMTHIMRKLLQEVCPDAAKRKDYPIVCDGAGVLWLPGRAPRDGSAGGTETKKEDKLYLIIGEKGHGLP